MKHQRIVTNADDLIAVYIADYQPTSKSPDVGKQRNSLPTQLRRLYHMMNSVIPSESLQKYGSNNFKDSSAQEFLRFVNDNYLMIQLSKNRYSNKKGDSLS